MQTDEAKVVNSPSGVFVNLPLTSPTGKIRIKRRSFFADYGEPVAPKQEALSLSHYVEWQIGYDLLAKGKDLDKNRERTSLPDLTFKNYKKEPKFVYELSEIVYYAYANGLLNETEIRECRDHIESVPEKETFEETESIVRTNSRPVTRHGLDFYEMRVSYPLFVHRFGQYEIFAEIVVREKQRAVGAQAMLFVCLPITALTFEQMPLERKLKTKECAEWRIGKEEASLALELFRVFGMLSPKHRYDVLAILHLLFPFLGKWKCS